MRQLLLPLLALLAGIYLCGDTTNQDGSKKTAARTANELPRVGSDPSIP